MSLWVIRGRTDHLWFLPAYLMLPALIAIGILTPEPWAPTAVNAIPPVAGF
jgi:hypothetical protein